MAKKEKKNRTADSILGFGPKREKYSEEAEHVEDPFRGVSISWLMSIFKLDRYAVKRKLEHCMPIRFVGKDKPIYSLREAAPYLVTVPEDVLTEMIEGMKPADMPTKLQKAYYDARMQRLRYQRLAGDLWHTTDVAEAFGSVFLAIKQATQMWGGQLERDGGLTAKQFEKLQGMCDALLTEIHTQINEILTETKTQSAIGDDDESDSE